MTTMDRPIPINSGTVAQVEVEYTGPRTVTFRIHPPGGSRDYFFGDNCGHRRQWVLREDAAFFANRPEFWIRWDTLIDPEREARAAETREVLAEELAVARRAQAATARKKKRRPGRAPMPGERTTEPYHLRNHRTERWPWGELAAYLTLEGDEVSEDALRKRCGAYKKRHSKEADETGCPLCLDPGYRPPSRIGAT